MPARNRSSHPSPETWIIGGTLVTQDDRRRVRRANLRIVEGRIVEISTRSPGRVAKRGAKSQVLDWSGLTVLPGFVQAHTHLCQTLFRNQADDLELLDWLAKRIWVMEAAHTRETLATSAKMGIYELLSTGTTTVLDMGTVRHTEAILETAKKYGIRGSFGKCLMDHPRTTPEGLRESTREALAEAEKLYRKWNGQGGDRLRISYAPRFVISCTESLLREVTESARAQKTLIHTHASENLKEIARVKELVHCENVEYLHSLGMTGKNLVLAHCVWLKPNEKELLRKTGTNVVHCPSSNLKLASGLAHVPDLRARGVNVALGADGAPCNNNLNMFTEMRLAALIHKPAHGPKTLPATDVLDMATRNGAKALSWWDDIGSLEVGKKADLIGLDLNQPDNAVPQVGPSAGNRGNLDLEAIASSIVYSSSGHHVRHTMVDGNLLFTGGKVRGIPSGQLVEEIRLAQTKISLALSEKPKISRRKKRR
jgi:cytosine/adenosine deaminase-related metal-dependent hydrolase